MRKVYVLLIIELEYDKKFENKRKNSGIKNFDA